MPILFQNTTVKGPNLRERKHSIVEGLRRALVHGSSERNSDSRLRGTACIAATAQARIDELSARLAVVEEDLEEAWSARLSLQYFCDGIAPFPHVASSGIVIRGRTYRVIEATRQIEGVDIVDDEFLWCPKTLWLFDNNVINAVESVNQIKELCPVFALSERHVRDNGDQIVYHEVDGKICE